jgi:Tol biopolymer transport system component
MEPSARQLGVFKNTPEPNVGSPSLSPDGRFLAYAERQPSGGVEVFLTQFPAGTGRCKSPAVAATDPRGPATQRN